MDLCCLKHREFTLKNPNVAFQIKICFLYLCYLIDIIYSIYYHGFTMDTPIYSFLLWHGDGQSHQP